MSDSENENHVLLNTEEEEIEEINNKIDIKNKDNKINKKNDIIKGNIGNNRYNNNNLKKRFQIKKYNNKEYSLNEENVVEKYVNTDENYRYETFPNEIDPNVKKLIELDFNSLGRNEIAELLLQDNLLSIRQNNNKYFQNTIPISKKMKNNSNSNSNSNPNTINSNRNKNNKIMSIKKENNKSTSRYKNIESTIKTYLANNSTKNYHIYNSNNQKGNSNFKLVTDKIIAKLSQNEKKLNIMKILFPKGIQKKNYKSDYFNNKINDALLKKQEDIEKIANKCNEEYNKKCTFTPIINKRNSKKNKSKRSLNQFLEDEKNHLQKMKDNIERMKNENEIKYQKSNPLIPKINKKSDYIFNKNKINNETVYNRLYNNRNQSEKKDLINNEKEKIEKVKKKTKSLQKRKISISRPKTVIKEKEKPKKYLLIDKDLSMNKIFLNYFNNHFNNISQNYFNDLYNNNKNNDNDSNNDNNNNVNELNFVEEDELNEIINVNNDNNQNKNNDKINEVNNIIEENKIDEDNKNEEDNNQKDKIYDINNNKKENKLTLCQLHELLYELGMCSKPIPEINTETNQINENIVQKKEKKLIIKLFNSIKNEDETIEIENLKQILISILGLYYYNLYKEYKLTHDENEVNLIVNQNKPKNEIIDFIIHKQNEENESKIDNTKNNNKYISYDKDNNIIIPLSKSKKIKTDFQLFCINYLSNSQKNKNKKKEKKKEEEKYTFKPKINKKNEYKEIIVNLKEVNENIKNNIDENSKILHNKYIERLYNKNNKKFEYYEKMREELQKKEMENCTFKPKTNNFSSITKSRGANRFNELFHKGSQKEKNRKNKTQEEFELEKYGSECTFKPNIKYGKININNNQNNNINFNNDIYNEKSYKLLYERLRNGRIERLIKESAHERFGYDDIIKNYIKKNKEKEEKDFESNEEENSEDENEENENDNFKNNNINNNNNKNKSKNKNKNSSKNKINESNEDEKDEEKKDAIPLLIIDVNIKEGVKKKIFVYEGDNPKGLAEKFAREHHLEFGTQEKLKNLIHNHMLRLLTRIDEENQSLSEK